jgi:hypothetical protein
MIEVEDAERRIGMVPLEEEAIEVSTILKATHWFIGQNLTSYKRVEEIRGISRGRDRDRGIGDEVAVRDRRGTIVEIQGRTEKRKEKRRDQFRGLQSKSSRRAELRRRRLVSRLDEVRVTKRKITIGWRQMKIRSP